MKKIFTKLMLLAVAATALVSCENKIDESTPVVELTQTVTLTAEKPVEVRTEMIEGVPYWSKGDQIGVYVVDGESYKNYAFKNDNEEATLTTSFTGETAVANTLFVYYPYTNFSNPVTEKGVKVEILANQEPTATSFDGRSDLMIAKPVQLDAEGKQLSDLEFARVAAIVKIVLKDNTSSLAGQHVSSLTMTMTTADEKAYLTGRVYVDVVNQEIFTGEGGNLYYGGSKSVTATYSEATQYEVDGTNATYVIVYPQTLAAGSTLSFEATTEGYAISKSIELGQDIVLESGKVTTLNVNLAAANVVKEETGLDLPIEDDFAWATGTSGITPNKEWWSSDFAYTYGNNGELRLGKSGECGHITTSDLNLSEPFTVVVDAKAWTTETSQVAVTAGGVTQKSENLPLEEAGFKTFVFKFDAVGSKEAIKIEITGKRGFIDNLHIIKGHDYVLPSVLTVSKSEISVSHEAATETFTYSVANPVEGVSATVTDNVDWITIADNNGTVTVTVAENTAEEAREGVITVTYGDLSKTVTVKQAAKPAEGGETASGWIRVTSLADITSGTYVIVANASGADYYCPNSTFQSSTHPKAVKIADKGVSVSGDQLVGTIIDDMKWTFTGTATNMVITKYNGTAQLYNTATNNGVWVATPQTASYWKFTVQGSNFLATYNSTNRCLGTYNTQDWRSYQNTSSGLGNFSNTNGEIRLYKLVGESGGEGGETPETPATPVLSINPTTLSFDAAAGSKTVTCTIENEVSGVNVTATESVDWLSTSVSGKTVTITATANTATTTRTANVTIAYTGAESKTVTVNQAAAENTGGGTEKVWTLVKSASEIAVGDQIIIAASGYNCAISTTQNSNNRGQAVITKSGETLATPANNVQILTVKAGSTSGTFAFYADSPSSTVGYLYCASTSSKNYLRTQASVNAAASWTIAIASNGVATIKSQISGITRNLLSYNQSSTCFACYSSVQKDVVIYKLK